MNLNVRYMGLELCSPLVASASPLSRTLDNIRRLEDVGLGAVVLYSLFAEQIETSDWIGGKPATMAPSLGYFACWQNDTVGPDEYLDLIAIARRTIGIPIIGSLNGVSPGDWTRYAKRIEQAGAAALELNLYYVPANPSISSDQVEHIYLETIREVKDSVTIPVAVKLAPFFTSLPHFARRLVTETKADALVLFNRFYQPDLNIETGEALPRLTYSTSDDLRLPMHAIATLRRAGLTVDMALTSGVHTGEDAIKALMAGSNVAMLASELLQHGIERATEIRTEMTQWLEAHGHASVAEIRGIANHAIVEPATWERSEYVQTLRSADPEAGRPFL
jgi:dihydroorotate dehydrogenase (fumarate)